MGEKKKILIWGTGNICNKVLNNGIQGKIIGFIESVKAGRNIGDCQCIARIPFRRTLIILSWQIRV